VDMSHFGKLELIDNRKGNFGDDEGFLMFRSEFGVGDGSFENYGLEPDFISFNERGEVLVDARGHDLGSEFMRSKSFVISSSEGL